MHVFLYLSSLSLSNPEFPQPVKADERPLESGSALAFFLHGEFFLATVTLCVIGTVHLVSS